MLHYNVIFVHNYFKCFFFKIAEVGFLGRYRAVFNTSCEDAWTLSPGISVPALRNFTVCVYFKLYNPKNNWTAFVYNKAPEGNLSALDHYELGLTGGRDKLTVWMFGKEITWTEELDEDTWYQICIKWQSERQEASVYINDKEKKSANLSETRQLLANGQLLLGCPKNPDVSSPSPDGMVGELYMFRMWSNGDINHTQDCRDGTIIRWRSDNWIYKNKTKEYSRSLPCGKLHFWIWGPLGLMLIENKIPLAREFRRIISCLLETPSQPPLQKKNTDQTFTSDFVKGSRP